MNKPTIKNIWAQNTTNRMDFTDSEISQGIVQKSNIISSQLNGVAYRSESFIELLQHTSAWNANKVYNKGDMCFVAVDFRTPSNTGKNIYVMILTSNVDNNTATPLSNNGNSPTFILDTNLTVPLYYIVHNSDTRALSSYANPNYWVANDLTMGDLTNTVKLIVGQEGHFAGNVDVSGKLTAGGVTIDGNTITADTINVSSVNLDLANSNSASTPAYNLNASSKDILNVEWFYKHNRMRLADFKNSYEVVALFNNTTKWTDCDYIGIHWTDTKTSSSYGYIFPTIEIILIALGKTETDGIGESNFIRYFNFASSVGFLIAVYDFLGKFGGRAIDEYQIPFFYTLNSPISCVGFKKK